VAGVFEEIPAVIWRSDAKASRLTEVSGAAEALFGYPAGFWTEQPRFWDDRMYDEDRASVPAGRAQAIQAAGAYDIEYRMVAADGRVVWVGEHGRLTRDGNELAGVTVDLSQKRSPSELLAQSKIWLRQIIDTIPQQIWSGPADGTVDFCNARWRDELGISLEEIRAGGGTGWQQVLHPEDRDRLLQGWSASVASGTPYEQEARLRTTSGQYRWFLNRGVPLCDEQGKVLRWFGSNTDIELQKRAEEELRASERRWRGVFDNASVGVAVTDSGLRFAAVNAACAQIVGYTPEEMIGRCCAEFVHEEDRAAHERLRRELLEGQRTRFDVEERYLTRSGDTVWVRTNGSVLPADSPEARAVVVVAVDVTERRRLHVELERERNWLRLLVDVTGEFIGKLELSSVLEGVLSGLEARGEWQWGAILLPDEAGDGLRVYAKRGEPAGIPEGAAIPIEGSIAGQVFRSGLPIAFDSDDFPRLSAFYGKSGRLQDLVSTRRFRKGCVLPLAHEGRTLGVLFLGTSADVNLEPADVDRLMELAQIVAVGLKSAARYDELASSNEILANQRNYVEEEVRMASGFEEVLGRSEALSHVLEQVQTVAPTESTVLLLGETGTGKELIARAIHDNSSRRRQPFVKIDCAAIPATLLESELFGHQRGAFTGAVAEKVGRFEVANRGTVFLDEVGELPPELQPKLLRVLQDQAFERLGSNRTVQLDVRVLAATNRDLQKMVEKGEFRADLYYRLKVFPILIPPLRERPEDIPALVWHYLRKYAQRMRKRIDTIPPAAMEVFTKYPWPGNVRELQHFLERSVVLTTGTTLRAPLRELEQVIKKAKAPGTDATKARTMEEIERESILQALRDSNWVVGGPHGAAARLGMKRTTLASRMEKHGIYRRHFHGGGSGGQM
jgi:formate hydrogenlyase transcriptional activator